MMAEFHSFEEVILTYCKYCGSHSIKNTEYQSANSWGGLTAYGISGVTAQAGGSGAGLNFGNSQTSTIFRRTMYCMTCKKIDVQDDLTPQEAKGSVNGLNYTFVIPGQLQRFLAYMNVDTSALRAALDGLSRRMDRSLHKFLQSGTNPCKKGEIGYSQKLDISSDVVDVRVLMEHKHTDQLVVRIVYDGGRSQCQ